MRIDGSSGEKDFERKFLIVKVTSDSPTIVSSKLSSLSESSSNLFDFGCGFKGIGEPRINFPEGVIFETGEENIGGGGTCANWTGFPRDFPKL